MRKTKQEDTQPRKAPALTPEQRENEMISLAIDLAEQQLRDGTASSQVITHYLKLGSIQGREQLENLKQENKLLKAKTESLESSKRIEELYKNALEAMRNYGGQDE